MSTARYFSPITIGLGTLFFTPLAGGMMLATNERRLGHPDKATKPLLAGALITLGAAAVVWFFHQTLPVLLLPLLFGSVWYIIAAVKQGEQVKPRIAEGQKANGKDLGIHLIPGAILMAGLTLVVVVQSGKNQWRWIEVGEQKHRVHYKGDHLEEAKTVGDALLASDHFGDLFTTYVELEVKGDTLAVAFPIYASDWDNPEWTGYADSLKVKLNQLLDAPLQLKVFDKTEDKRMERGF